MNQKATRDQIVEAADRLFYQKGYEYTSFSESTTSYRAVPSTQFLKMWQV